MAIGFFNRKQAGEDKCIRNRKSGAGKVGDRWTGRPYYRDGWAEETFVILPNSSGLGKYYVKHIQETYIPT